MGSGQGSGQESGQESGQGSRQGAEARDRDRDRDRGQDKGSGQEVGTEVLLSLLSGSHIFSIFVLQCIQHMHCIMGPCRARRIGASRRRRWPVRKALQLFSPPAAFAWSSFKILEDGGTDK